MPRHELAATILGSLAMQPNEPDGHSILELAPRFNDDPRVRAASNEAVAYYLLAVSRCVSYGYPAALPREHLPIWRDDATDLVAELVEHDLLRYRWENDYVYRFVFDLDGSPLRLVRPQGRPALTPERRQIALERGDYRCQHCGATDNLQIDHIWPWVLGGSSRYWNLQPLCQPCNGRKGGRVPARADDPARREHGAGVLV